MDIGRSLIMKNAMRVATLFVLMSLSLNAHAQFAMGVGIGMAGTGQWGAQQSCPYNYSAGAGASSELDGMREATTASKRLESKLKTKRRQLEKLDKELERARQDVEDVVQGKYAQTLFTHIEQGASCEEYGNGAGRQKSSPYKADEWSQICGPNGLEARYACAVHLVSTRGSRGGGSGSKCVRGLDIYESKWALKERLAQEVARGEEDLERYSDKIQTAKDDYLDKLKEGQNTQGGICWDCLMRPSGGSGSWNPNWGSVLVNGAVGALAIYSGMQQNKQVQRQNANMGWPSYPYDAMQAGYPFIRDALYGAIGGGIGQGAYGCAGGIGGAGYPGGPFGAAGPFGGAGPYGMSGVNGYPMGYSGMPMGGGMYNPGMGPWGLNGPNGMMGPGPIPIGGYQVGGFQVGGFQVGGFPAGGGYAVGGPMGGGPIPIGGYQVGGYQVGGFQVGGYPIGGYGVQVGGYQMGGYGPGPIPIGGGYAVGGPIGGGYAVGGYPVGGYGGYAVGGYPVGGYPGGIGYGSPYGGFPYSNGIYPGPPGGYGGYGPGYGYGYGGYGAGGYGDRSAINYGQTSTVINGLNQEMYNLQMRLRTVQGSSYGYGTTSTIGGYYNGVIGNGITGTGYIGIGTAAGSTSGTINGR